MTEKKPGPILIVPDSSGRFTREELKQVMEEITPDVLEAFFPNADECEMIHSDQEIVFITDGYGKKTIYVVMNSFDNPIASFFDEEDANDFASDMCFELDTDDVYVKLEKVI